MKFYLVAALVASSTMIGCASQKDTLGEQLAQFRASRHIYDRAYVRCNELVNEKYRQRIYGAGNLEGPDRLEAINSARLDHDLCTKHFQDKASALWKAQSPEVHAFYDAKRPTLHKEMKQVNDEAEKWLSDSPHKPYSKQ